MISENDDGRRIFLSATASKLLSNEVQRIRQQGAHYKVNEAKLASAIIDLFFERYLERHRERLQRKFFERRIYLKNLIQKAASEEDLSSSINEYLQLSKVMRKSRPDLSGEESPVE